MAEISNNRKQDRERRILCRAQNYINGDISLDTFVMLEQLDNEDEADIVEALAKERHKKEAEAERAERRVEADKLRDLQEKEKAKAEPGPKQAKPKKREPVVPELVNMTKDEFNALSVWEQTRLYNLDPDRVREIVESRPAYMDIIDPRPKPKDYTGLTLQEFKKMPIHEMQALYDADPDLYKQLSDERATSRG